MSIEDYNLYCSTLLHTHSVIQWGGAHVWKVDSKVFAVISQEAGNAVFVTFKCSDMSFSMLKDQPGLRPAPYLASRGMLWIQRTSDASMDGLTLQKYLKESHRLASLNLTKKRQRELGINGN